MCDGVSVSLSPSIGNWSEKCESHYWIINNRVQWASRFSRREILQTRRLREWERERYFSTNANDATADFEAERFPIVTSIRRYLTRIWHRIVRRH